MTFKTLLYTGFLAQQCNRMQNVTAAQPAAPLSGFIPYCQTAAVLSIKPGLQ